MSQPVGNANPSRVLLASRSPGKLRELAPLLRDAGIETLDLVEAGVLESPEEDRLESHSSFEDNALAKARYFHALTRLPVVADDSGLCVDALGGRPGVHSKRWSGRTDLTGQALDDANNALLQAKLAGVIDRRARYVCAAAFVDASRTIVARGETSGVIVPRPSGAGGFGYDPYFWSDDLRQTFAEVAATEKAGVSHRGRAVLTLLHALGVRR